MNNNIRIVTLSTKFYICSMLKRILLSSLLVAASIQFYGQGSISDTTKTIPYISISYQFYVPGGDLADRFGVGNIIEGEFIVKLRSNFEIGAGGAYIFGDQVKQKDMLHNMITSDGNILDDNIKNSEVFFFHRGWKTGISVAKIFPILSPNPNSGIKLDFGIGYNQHWIRIEHQENTIPQLSDEYKPYYDRKAGGLYLEQFIGYILFSNRGLANFTGGFEFRQGFNKELRSYNIDDMSYVEGSRMDLYFGVKVSWNILLYKRSATGYYYD